MTRWQLLFYTKVVRLVAIHRRTPLFLFFLFLSLSNSLAQTKKPETSGSFDLLAKQAAEARDADRLDEAVGLYKKALLLRPKWKEGWWSLGMIEYDRSKYDVAARAFRRFLPLAPTDGTAQVMLGLCEFELGQDGPALKHLEEGKALGFATNPQLRIVLLYHDGILLLRAGQFKSAQIAFMNLCALGEQQAEVLQNLGLAFLRILPKDAPSPGNPGHEIVQRVGHAACLSGQKKYDEAKGECAALVGEYPDYPNLHYAYGRFLADTNDGPGGIEQFKLELKNQPQDVNARLEIAAAEYKVDSGAGLPYAQQAVELNPRLPFAHYLLGLLYVDTDQSRAAIPELEIARGAFPKDRRLYLALASAYSREGRKQEAATARAVFERLSKEAGSNIDPTY